MIFVKISEGMPINIYVLKIFFIARKSIFSYNIVTGEGNNGYDGLMQS